MGFFDFDTGSVISARSSHSRRHSSHHSKKHSKHRSRSRSSSSRGKRHSAPGIAASIFGGGGDDDEGKRGPSRSSSSFFGIPNASRSSFFGFGGRPSYYKRSPRGGFIQKTLKQVKRLWRDLVYYAKRHPWKVVALVLMPLLTGGFLTALLARFGLRLPPGVERMIGIGAKAASGDSVGLVGEAMRMATSAGLGSRGGGGGGSVNIERGYDGGYQWERRSVERDGPGGGGGWADGLISGVAKMFV